jgi:hypothetical protein
MLCSRDTEQLREACSTCQLNVAKIQSYIRARPSLESFLITNILQGPETNLHTGGEEMYAGLLRQQELKTFQGPISYVTGETCQLYSETKCFNPLNFELM